MRRAAVLGTVRQFRAMTGAAPAREPRKLAPGRRRGSARGHYGASARSWLTGDGF